MRLSRRSARSVWEEIPQDTKIFDAGASYLLEGPPDVLDGIWASYPEYFERLGTHALRLDFGNAVGFFNVPLLGRIEVRCGKWDARHWDQMLWELTEVAGGLPFSATVGAALPYERSVTTSQDVLYHEF